MSELLIQGNVMDEHHRPKDGERNQIKQEFSIRSHHVYQVPGQAKVAYCQSSRTEEQPMGESRHGLGGVL